MIKSKVYTQVDPSFFQVNQQYVNVIFSMLLAVLMLAGVWGTTAVFAATPIITPGQTFAVLENSVTGTSVGTVATSGDVATGFSIVAGNSGNAFSIDAGGTIKVQTGTAVDFETTPVFTLTIRANDDSNSDEDVIVNVINTNDAPVVAPYQPFNFAENSGIGATVGTIAANDPDGNSLTYSIVQWISASGPFLVDLDDGEITATADLNYETDQLSYIFIVHISDGILDSYTTVTIDLTNGNDAPVALDDSDANYTIGQNGTLTFPEPTVLANDSDADGDGLEAVNATKPVNGEVTLNTDGTFTYTPDTGFDGVDTFTYQAQDDGTGSLLSNVATVYITVTGTNDAPTAVDDSYFMVEEGKLTVSAEKGVLGNDTDPEHRTLAAVLDADVLTGTLSLNLSDGSFEYIAPLNYTGIVTFTYHANDGVLGSNSATVTITVSNVNDSPVVDDETWAVAENEAIDFVVGTLDVTDPDDDMTFSFNVLSGNTNGAFYIDDVTHELRVATSNALDFETTPVFTLTVEVADTGNLTDTATVIVNLKDVNEAPTAVGDPDYTTPEDTPLFVDPPGVLDNDTDPEKDPLTVVYNNDVSSGDLELLFNGAFIYTPTLDFTGVVTFTYYAHDSGLPSATPATVTITVEPQNDAPVADDDAYETDEDTPLSVDDAESGVLDNDDDVDGDEITAVLDLDVSVGDLRLNPDGSFEYDPPLNFTGIVTFTYHANDSTLNSNSATVTINVVPTNDGPVIEDQSFDIDENRTANFGPVVATDIDEDTLSYGTLPGGSGDTILGIDPVTGEITVLNPTALNMEQDQSFTLTVIVSDTEPLTDTATITINLNNVNEFAPIIEANQTFTISETAANSSSVGTVEATDDDWQELPSIFAIMGGDSNNVFSIDNSGNIIVQNNATLDFETTDVYTLTIQVTDNGTNPSAKFSTEDVYVHVTDTNDPPVINEESLTVTPAAITEGQTITLTGSFTDQDAADAHTLTIDWGDGTVQPPIPLAAGVTNIEVSHTYNDDPAGLPDTYTIQVTVSDDVHAALAIEPEGGSSDTAYTSVTVTNVDPSLSEISLETSVINEGQSATLGGIITDPGTDDTFTLSVDWGDGAVVPYTYAAGTSSFSESHTFLDDGQPLTVTLTLTDDDEGEVTDEATITVNNLPPNVNAGIDRTENVNQAFNFAGSFTDPGANDTHTIEWDYGDTTSDSGSLTPSYSYSAIGVYTATLTVTDDEGAYDLDQVVVEVVSPSNLVATKTVRGDFAEESVITYTITITNNGASAQLDNVGNEFMDVLPTQLALVDARVLSGGGTANATIATNTVTWNGSIASNSSVVIEIEATILLGTKGETVSNRGDLYYDADGNGDNEATTHTDDPTVAGSYDHTVFEVKNEYFIFMPVILNNFTAAPDLIVTDINASSDLIEVVIENQGNAPVFNSFWVDFYINPTPAPTAANELWPELAHEGLAWGVTDGVAVGETITLTFSTEPGAPNLYFVAGESVYHGSLPAGTQVYAQVDSAHAGIGNGAITELDELGYGSYNNILGDVALATPQ